MRRVKSTAIALLSITALLALPAAAQASFGIEPGSVETTAFATEGGLLDTQASSHPFSWTVSFKLNTDKEGHSEGGELRSFFIDLPPGFAGYPTAVPRCSRQEFEGFTVACSPNSQVGIVKANLPAIGTEVGGPLFNMVPPPGVPAQLGFAAAGLNAFENISLGAPEDGYGLRSTTNGLPLEATSIEATIWGTPADESHDDQRGVEASEGTPGKGHKYVGPHEAFLTMPATCDAPLKTTVSVDSKLDPGHYVSESAESLGPGGEPEAQEGCANVPFNPKVASATTSKAASASTGLDFELKLPNEGLTNPGGIAETEPHKIEVTLPEGITANPSAAEGLATCTEAQYGSEHLETAPGAGCPEASKLGSIVAHSPLLDEPIVGSLYLATPYENPHHTLIGLYLVFRAVERGVLLKQSAKVVPDPKTGQLVTTLEGLPPLPYSDATLHFKEGARGVLVTPGTCGSFATTAKLYPFSQPNTPVTKTAYMQIERGPNGGPCPSGGEPFNGTRKQPGRRLLALLLAPDPPRRRSGPDQVLLQASARCCRKAGGNRTVLRRGDRPGARPHRLKRRP